MAQIYRTVESRLRSNEKPWIENDTVPVCGGLSVCVFIIILFLPSVGRVTKKKSKKNVKVGKRHRSEAHNCT